MAFLNKKSKITIFISKEVEAYLKWWSMRRINIWGFCCFLQGVNNHELSGNSGEVIDRSLGTSLLTMIGTWNFLAGPGQKVREDLQERRDWNFWLLKITIAIDSSVYKQPNLTEQEFARDRFKLTVALIYLSRNSKPCTRTLLMGKE